MAEALRSQKGQLQKSSRHQNNQNLFPPNDQHQIGRNWVFTPFAYDSMHWDAAYVDQKYYLAHPLALDKLIKLEEQIRIEKGRLNVMNKWDQAQLQKEIETKRNDIKEGLDETIQSDHRIYNASPRRQCDNRINSALSRDCKTEANELKELKGRAEVEKELAVEEEKYKQKLEEMKKKRNDKLKGNTELLIHVDDRKSHKGSSGSAKKSDLVSKKSGLKHSRDLVAPHELIAIKNNLANSKASEKSKKEPSLKSSALKEAYVKGSQRYEAKEGNLETNFISFQPDETLYRGGAQRASGEEYDRHLQESELPQKSKGFEDKSISGKRSQPPEIHIQDKFHQNKSFVINYKRTPSNRSRDNSEGKFGNLKFEERRRQLKSASSIGSKIHLEKLNKKIKEMQEKLHLIEIRQDQLQNMEYSRIKEMRESHLREAQSYRERAQENHDDDSGNQARVQLELESELKREVREERVQRPHSSQEKGEEEEAFDVVISKTKKLNFTGSIFNYNYAEALETQNEEGRKEREKEKLNEEIADLKRIIRELKLEKIHHQSIIEQLENRELEKEKQKERLKALNKSHQLVSNTNYQPDSERKITEGSNFRKKTEERQGLSQGQSKGGRSLRIDPYADSKYRVQGAENSNQESPKKLTRSQLQKNDSSDLPIPRKDHYINIKNPMGTSKVLTHSIEESMKQKQRPRISNPQEEEVGSYHIGKQGIIVRQVGRDEEMDEKKKESPPNENSYYQNFSNFVRSKHSPYQHELEVEPHSPTSTGKQIFELQFVREIKSDLVDIQDWPNIATPQIKIRAFEVPDLPASPSPSIMQKQLLQLSERVCNIFGINTNEKELYMKKYKNCVIFKTPDPKRTVVWHYNGKFYIGGWEQNHLGEGKKMGQGFEYYPDRYYYQGQFYEGKKNGSGIMITLDPHRTIYNGQWYQGEKHGIGTLYDEVEKSYYEGEFHNNKKQGKGILKISEAEFYDGTFSKSIKHGYGIEKFANGDIYKGEYKQGRFHGLGKYFWANGSSYDGHFAEGHREGSGKWRSAKKGGDAYIGEYKQDKKQGRGQYIWSNGCRYDGNFQNDLKHGDGRVEYPDGREIKGSWENGKLIEIEQNIVENSDGYSSSDQPLRKPKLNQIFQTPSKELRHSKYMHRI